MSGLEFELRVCPESTLLTSTLVAFARVLSTVATCVTWEGLCPTVSLGLTQGTCVASWGVFVSLDLQAFKSWGGPEQSPLFCSARAWGEEAWTVFLWCRAEEVWGPHRECLFHSLQVGGGEGRRRPLRELQDDRAHGFPTGLTR